MQGKRKHRTGLIALAILLLLVGTVDWLTYAQMQRQKLSPLLIAAASKRNYNEVDSLLDRGADPNCSQDDWLRSDFWSTLQRRFTRSHERLYSTVLMNAAKAQDFRMIQLLLHYGADVNVRAGRGITALMWAARSGPQGGAEEAIGVECLRLLVDAGADVDATALDGYTALLWAAGAGHKACVALLLNEGARVDARDSQGRTALWYARKDPDMIAFLKKSGAKE